MEENHHFDKRGFLFFIKFILSISILIAFTYYGIYAFSENTILTKIYNVASADMQLATITQNRQEALLEIKNEIVVDEQEKSNKHSAYLGFVGDIMLDREVEKAVIENSDEDFSFPFEFVEEKLKKYDVLFGNLEGSISDKGRDLGSVYSFRMNPKVADALKSVGFDVLSVANNHAGDWGIKATTDTYSRLSTAGIIYSGGGFNETEAYAPKIIESNGLKIAYISFSEFGKGYLEAVGNNPGIAIISNKKLKTAIESVAEKSDIIVVSFHYGDEYKTEPNLYQKTISEAAINYGADLVIGHHPHTVQPITKYKDGYIAYSLGNFIFDQNFPEDRSNTGLILEVIISDKEIVDIKNIEIGFNNFFQPYVIN